MRITRAHLDAKADIVNGMLGIDSPGWNVPGTIEISGDGGYAVHRVCNDSHGVSDLTGGHGPAREAAAFLSGMIAALRIAKDGA
jgi:hypothetical protein